MALITHEPSGAAHPAARSIAALRAGTACGAPAITRISAYAGRQRHLHDPPGEPRLLRDDRADRAREDRPALGRDRRAGRVPVGRAQAARRAGHPRPAVPDRVRRHGDGHADAEHGGRGDRQGRRVVRADPDGAGARHAADPAVRHRRAQGAVPAAVRDGRVVAGVRAVRARGRLGPGGDEDDGGQGRRRMGDQRHQELDLEPRRGRLLHLLRGHRPRDAAG